ncbi:MAG: A24 family peptidase [Caldilineaceae bacterium]
MASVSLRHLLMQQPSRLGAFLLAGLLFVYAGWVVGAQPEAGLGTPLPLLFFYLALLSLITVIDLEQRRVPNLLVGPAAIVALSAAALQSPQMLLSAIFAGGIGFVGFLLIGLIRPGAMGGGDIKLAGLIGLITGLPYVVAALVIGVLAGGIGAAIFMITGRVKRTGSIAYAPYLCAGAVIVLLHGAQIVAWYLH